jgi:hypothetical protein
MLLCHYLQSEADFNKHVLSWLPRQALNDELERVLEGNSLEDPSAISPLPLQKFVQTSPVTFEGFVSDDEMDSVCRRLPSLCSFNGAGPDA